MPRRTKEEAAETWQQILDAALDVFSRKGYSRTTFVDIAEQIGLTKGAVYWHFSSKTELLTALIETMLTHKMSTIAEAGEITSSLCALRRFYIESARHVLSDARLRKFEFFVNFQIEWSEQMIADVRTHLTEMGEDPFRKYTVAILKLQEAGRIDPSLDAEKLGSLLFATWMGLLRMTLVNLITEADFIYRLEYSFDSMFKDIANKEHNDE